MEKKTYAEWKASGFQVNRGEKASGRNIDGAATFSRNQVKILVKEYRSPRDNFNSFDHDDLIWNGVTEEDFLGYTPGDQ